MSCMTLFAQPITMTTIQLVRETCYDSWQMEPRTERKPPLNMSWTVVTDESGKRQLRMRWTLAETD
jgi:hypothetical protein